ncbi:MAG: hypothetical protein U9R27_02080 [Campylobacterota bacterium]|nr:hypothetical protein [Campylobacterota bacterium]
MSIKKFIESVKLSLGLKKFEERGKRRSIKRLLAKLNSRKKILHNISKKRLNKAELKELIEEREIISLQIKKGEKILHRLDS